MTNKPSTKPRRHGPIARPEFVRSERLTLRVHPDLMRILTVRARERGISRSQYVDQLLVGWVQADPRNPKIDATGRIVPGAPAPLKAAEAHPLVAMERWRKFSTAQTALLGSPPPDAWFEDRDTFLDAAAL